MSNHAPAVLAKVSPPLRHDPPPELADVWDQFYAYCFAIIRECPGVRRLNETDRDDCIQDVMAEIVRRFGSPGSAPAPAHLDAWLRTVSRNKAADVVRRKVRKPEVFFEDGAGSAVLDDAADESRQPEYISLVWEALLALDQEVSATSYLVFYLRTIEGWDMTEVADLFGMNSEQARARCHRVRKKFAALLRERGGDLPS